MGFMLLNPNKETEAMASADDDDDNNVCTDLTLGLCPCTTLINYHYQKQELAYVDGSDSSNNKNKHKLLESQATINNEGAKRKKKGCSSNNQEEEKRNLSWDCTTELKLYDDQWKIKKVLEKSDLGNMSRLLIGTEFAEKLIPPVLGVENVVGDNGIHVTIKDVDTIHKSSYYNT